MSDDADDLRVDGLQLAVRELSGDVQELSSWLRWAVLVGGAVLFALFAVLLYVVAKLDRMQFASGLIG